MAARSGRVNLLAEIPFMPRTSHAGLLALVAATGLAAPAFAQPDAGRATEPVKRYDNYRQVRVEVRTARDLQTAMALTDDVWTHTLIRGQPIDILVSPEQFALLLQSGLRFTILNNNVQATIDAETAQVNAARHRDDPTWYTAYHNYTDVKTYTQALAAAYPNICTYSVIGQSLQGRDIFAIRITGPGSTANRPASLWIGGQHAREWINVPVPMYHAEQLLTNYATDAHIQYLVNNQEFIFVFIMNPDGYDYTWTNDRYWRKNRKANSGTNCTGTFGVDLNRNWGYQWGGAGASTNCSDLTYRGTGPFSEPETQVMRNLIQANPRIRSSMDWHSYGRLVMSPWGYTSALPTPQSAADLFQSLDNQIAEAILAVHGTAYTPGPVYTTIYPASGVSVDWVWGSQGALGLTIELPGTDFVFPPTSITPTCEETYAGFLVLANYLTPCYANCDGSTGSPVLTVNDFICFQSRFASGDSYANCDGSTTTPALTVNDFICFQTQFASGCP
jgi:murein tripeptide amidase MpaA